MNNHEDKPFAAPAGCAHFDDATIEEAALKHVATDWHRISHLIPNYRCTEQFARLKAFAEELAGRCRAQGGNTNSNSPEFAGIKQSSTAPTVEVDERAAFEAWWHERLLKSWQSTLLGSEYGKPMPGNWGDGYKRHAMEAFQAGRASKPPAREAAERQSIDTPEFHCLLLDYRAAQFPRMAQQAYEAIIAHIDTWAGAAPAQPLAYIAPHVMESLRAGCHVATVLSPVPDEKATEALYGR